MSSAVRFPTSSVLTKIAGDDILIFPYFLETIRLIFHVNGIHMKCQSDCLKKIKMSSAAILEEVGNRTAESKCSKIIAKFCWHYMSVWSTVRVLRFFKPWTQSRRVLCFVLLYYTRLPCPHVKWYTAVVYPKKKIVNQSQRIPNESHSSQTYLPKRYIMPCHVCP